LLPSLEFAAAVWTFFYNDDDFCSSGDEPIINHEIDIELPGRPSAAHENIEFSQALLNTWTGEIGSLYETGYTSLGKYVDDDAFHVWRFDWHTDPSDRRVEFYLDGGHLRTMRNVIPFYAGRLWIGAWFPNGWAGEPNFAEAQMEVDYVKFTPFDETFECPNESFPDFGWAAGTDIGLGEIQLCTPSPPSPPGTPSPMSTSTPPPITPAPTNSPGGGNYLNDGCSNLAHTFCNGYLSDSYCKTWSQDHCGRSVCQGDSFSALNRCTPNPTPSPNKEPSDAPSKKPTDSPSKKPTSSPTVASSKKPTDSPSKNPTGSPSKKPTGSPFGGNYLNDGCSNLPSTFCSSYIAQSYCKHWQHDDCGRSVCHGDSHSSLSVCQSKANNPSPLPTNAPSPMTTNSDPTSIYQLEGCAVFPDMDSFCHEYNGGYCKYWQSDGCGRSVCKGDSHTSLFGC
jgi:hypothetical protein